ncbi:MAG: sensor histidine kinase [Bacteroidales bacterium]|nr:sensor histidine kinase [Bacteroidales bacterium]
MKIWFDTIKSRLLLTFITYCFYVLLCFATDEHIMEYYCDDARTLWQYIVGEVITFAGCFLFVWLSICYSRVIFSRFRSLEKPYRNLLIHAIVLFLMNNLTAYVLSWLTSMMFDMEDIPFMQLQHLYIYSILATFISSIYINAFYLSSYMTSETEKKRLEMEAMQARLNALKQQIDPHFMFNNFSILSELIVEDRELAGKFLDRLSKVYRYVIRNYDRDTVPVQQELTFLEHYLYLMEIRYEGAICFRIAPELKQAEGSIPPVCLQLLVENALKHNSFSEQSPLRIELYEADGCIVVRNNLQPLATPVKSTGMGQRNILERYAILCGRKPLIRQTEESYAVALPLLPIKQETPKI